MLTRFRSVHLAVMLVTLALASAVACNSTEATSPDEGPGTRPEDGGTASGEAGPEDKLGTVDLDAYAAGECAYEFRCFAGEAKRLFADAASCTTARSEKYKSLLSLAGVSITKPQMDACIAKLKSGTCERQIAACMFKGTAANGTACFSAAQCSSGSCYKAKLPVNDGSTTTEACGTCTPVAAVGGDCTSAECAPGASCQDKKCEATAAVGASCAEALCERDATCSGGKCVKHLQKDEACEDAEDAISCSFAAGLECRNGKCVEKTYAKLGESCASGTCTGSMCEGRKCIAYHALNEACTTHAGGSSCAPNLECRDKKCVRDDPTACK